MSSGQVWPLLAAAAILCWLVLLAYSRPIWIAGLALCLFAWESIFGSTSGVEIGGIAIYGRDAVFLAMATAGIARLCANGTRRGGATLAGWVWWALLLLVAVSLLRGVQSYGANLAGNDFRPLFYLLAGLVSLSTLPVKLSHVRDIIDIWIGVGLILAAVAFARMIGLRIGPHVEQLPFLEGRPLYAWSSLLIAQATLFAFYRERLTSRWARIPGLPYVLLVAVLISRQRTVWVAMVVCVAAMWTVFRREKMERDTQVRRHGWAICVAAAVIVVIIATGEGGSLERDLASSTRGATAQNSTFLWRLEGWSALLDQQRASPQDLLVGVPYGAGYHRTVFRTEVEYSPHSWYVQTVSRVGVLGCVLMLIALVGLLRRARTASLFPRSLASLLLLSTAVYGITYHPPETQGILIGLIVLAVGHTRATGAQPHHSTRLTSGDALRNARLPIPQVS